MAGSSLAQSESLFLILLTLVVLFAVAARALRVPYPIVLVMAGIAISVVPGVPRVRLQPDLIFLVVLPPLLFSAGWALSWREFRRSFNAITLLAGGLVSFTIVALCLIMRFALPDFTWKPAFILGAVVAATDAIAATSLARKLGLPSHITELLEAESLLNDGTGLLAFQIGLTVLVTGYTPTPIEAFGKLIFLLGAGVLIGLAIAALVAALERWVDDGPVEIAISLVLPYATYLLADKMHASGVIAVIACSMYMSRYSHEYMAPDVRLQAGAVWEAVTFILNGFVFILIGLQLPFVLTDVRGLTWRHLALLALGFNALLLALRFGWLFAETRLSQRVRRWSGLEPTRVEPLSELVVISWGGMRGVLSLAAAVSLPYTIANGAPFTQRSMIIFLTFSVIVSTLVVQGLTFPLLIQRLSFGGHKSAQAEEHGARRFLLETALGYLTRRRTADRFGAEIVDDLVRRYQTRLNELPRKSHGSRAQMSAKHRREAVLTALSAEREALLQLRNEDAIGDDVMRSLQRELDLTESRVHTGAMDV